MNFLLINSQVDIKYQNTMKALRAVIVPGNGSGDVANANWYVGQTNYMDIKKQSSEIRLFAHSGFLRNCVITMQNFK
jgi:hypothetical protein